MLFFGASVTEQSGDTAPGVFKPSLQKWGFNSIQIIITLHPSPPICKQGSKLPLWSPGLRSVVSQLYANSLALWCQCLGSMLTGWLREKDYFLKWWADPLFVGQNEVSFEPATVDRHGGNWVNAKRMLLSLSFTCADTRTVSVLPEHCHSPPSE